MSDRAHTPMESISSGRVLVVDDEPDMLNMLQMVLRKKCGCEVDVALSGYRALEMLNEKLPDVIVSDIKMPDLDGLTLLKHVKEINGDIAVIIMTGYGTIEMAVQSLKDGAYDFLQKPFEQEHVVRVVQNCLERAALMRNNQLLQQQISTLSATGGIIGQSAAIRKRLDLLARVAETDATVLIRGESGTGKELAARALHAMSDRKDRPIVTVNCPALPEQILESELFGYSSGAFTGAHKDKKGLFLEANGSTLVLDEIGDMPVSVQAKLLRVLQEKEIQPLGQNKTISIDVRVVACTNQDLEQKIADGEFREDLYHRLNIISVTMPNLEEMKEDVPLLIHHYLNYFSKKYEREGPRFSPEQLSILYQRKWTGNVRELRNTIERMVLLSGEEPLDMVELLADSEPCVDIRCGDPFADVYDKPYNDAKKAVVQRFSKAYLEKLLFLYGGNVTQAATGCGLERQALQRLLRRFGLSSKDYRT